MGNGAPSQSVASILNQKLLIEVKGLPVYLCEHRCQHGCSSDYPGRRRGVPQANCEAGRPFWRRTAYSRMEDHRRNDPPLLPARAREFGRALPRMPEPAGLCRRATRTLPIWNRQADLRQVPGPLLSARAPGADQNRHAFGGATHGLASSLAEPASLARQRAVTRDGAGCAVERWRIGPRTTPQHLRQRPSRPFQPVSPK